MKIPVLLSWSGGKDSALALHMLGQDDNIQVVALLTTVTQDFDRISMHGVRTTLLEQQAHCLKLPLDKVLISKGSTNEDYEHQMQFILEKHKANGVATVAFGDIFLEDLRKYREENLSRIGMRGIFPIWKSNTAELAHDFLDLNFKAVIACVDSQSLDGKYAGREFNRQFLSDLPLDVDPCGENGEFHSFVYDGPIFEKMVPFKRGEVVLRDSRFYFCDLIPVS